MVFAGRQINLDRPVAIKVMRGGMESQEVSRERFRREAVWTGALNHANVVTYHDFLLDDDNDMVLVMEFLHGATLDEVTSPAGRMDAERATRLVAGAARGLAEAHRNGIVHRDVKPSNIFVTWPGTRREGVKVIDFGILWADPGVKGDHDGLTRENAFIGTPDYVAPEVLVGGNITGRTDQYGLALVLLRTITGAKPWPGRGGPALLARLAIRPSLLDDPLVAVFPALHGALFKALSPEPGDRFSDMDAFADALEDAISTMSPVRHGDGDGPTVLEFRGGPQDAVVCSAAQQQTCPDSIGPHVSMVAASDLRSIDVGDSRGLAPVEKVRPKRRRGIPAAILALVVLGLIAGGAVAVVLEMDVGGFAAEPVSKPSESASLRSESSARTLPVVDSSKGIVTPEADPAGLPAADPAGTAGRPAGSGTAQPVMSSGTVTGRVGPAEPEVPTSSAAGMPQARNSGAPAVGDARPTVSSTNRPARPARDSSATPKTRGQPVARPNGADDKGVPGQSSLDALDRSPGEYEVNVKPYAYVSINGRNYGRTPVGPLKLDSGTYKVIFSHDSLPSFSRTVSIEAGKKKSEFIPYPKDTEGM